MNTKAKQPTKKDQTKKNQIAALTRRAEKGNAEAQYRIGLMYSCGDGVKRDEEVALEWLDKAARQGHVEAQYQAGYLSASADEADDWAAREYWLVAARQGHAEAMYYLGWITIIHIDEFNEWYDRSIFGDRQDQLRYAFQWIRNAKALGQPDAIAYLAEQKEKRSKRVAA